MEVILLPDNMTTLFHDLKAAKGLIINYEIQTTKMFCLLILFFLLVNISGLV